MSTRFRAVYGASPRHLIAVTVAVVPAGYTGLRLLGDPTLAAMLLWFVAAVVAHDLVLFPLSALADRTLGPPRPPLRNHVRAPALGSALLFLLFLPGILRQGTATFGAATGLTQEPFALRWLLLSAGMFAASALLYAVRTVRQRAARKPASAAANSAGRSSCT